MGGFKFRTSLVAIALLLGGCAQTTWQTEKTVVPGYSGNPKMVFAVYFTDSGIDNAILAADVERHLRLCGIKVVSSILPGVSYSGSPTDFIGASPADADSFLVVSGMDTSSTRAVDSLYGAGASKKSVGQYLRAEFHDRASKALVWRSEIYLTANNGVATYNAAEKGGNLAKGLVGYLVNDGIVGTCPRGGK